VFLYYILNTAHVYYELFAFTIQEQETVSIMVLQSWQSHFDLQTMMLV